MLILKLCNYKGKHKFDNILKQNLFLYDLNYKLELILFKIFYSWMKGFWKLTYLNVDRLQVFMKFVVALKFSLKADSDNIYFLLSIYLEFETWGFFFFAKDLPVKLLKVWVWLLVTLDIGCSRHLSTPYHLPIQVWHLYKWSR